MLYDYVELEDGTQIAYSDVNEDETVRVEIERPRDWGFDSATCLLPADEWSGIDGFTNGEILSLTGFLQRNAPLIFRFAHEGNLRYA